MKKVSILICLFLTAFTFQCSDRSNEPTQFGMNPELKKEVDAISLKLNAVWVAHYRTNFTKRTLTNPTAASSIFGELRATLDPQRQTYFDAVMKHPEMLKMIGWCQAQIASIKNNGGRIADVWDVGTVTSVEVQNRVNQLHADINYTLSGMEVQNKDAIKAAIYTEISDAENSAYQSSTLTQNDKDVFGSAASILYGEVDSVVDEFYGSDIPVDQTRIQSWFRNFMAKVGSVVAVTVICALAAAAIGAIIVATGGAALLGEGALLTIGAAEFTIVSVSAAIGGAAGLTYGTAMAIDNQCFSNGANGSTFGFETCTI